MMAIASAMGSEEFIKAQSLFNFGSRTGIDLPNEGYGIIHTADTMGVTELACSAFGQGITCTMIQEINAMCSVINGGYYYQPHLVKEVKDSSGSTVRIALLEAVVFRTRAVSGWMERYVSAIRR